MIFYLSSPGQQMQADYCRDMPVLISYALWSNWMASYTQSYQRSVDSCDSTRWFRDAWEYKNQMEFLTPAECVELVVKRYKRMNKLPLVPADKPTLFDSKQ